MKIAIVVHGRFHAFHLARELYKKGEDIYLFSNYPYFGVKPFGIPRRRYRGLLWHGLMARFLSRIQVFFGREILEGWMHKKFSFWAASILKKSDWDVVYVFSGIAEEVFESLNAMKTIKILVRGSAHIVTQRDILLDEKKRARVKIDEPSAWIVDKEMREYEMADSIVVLSSFAQKSFVDQGVLSNKVFVLPLGVDVTRFRSSSQKIQDRCRRILSGEKLRVLMTGNFSYQKGALDFKEIVSSLHDKLDFCFVGTVTSEAAHLAKSLTSEVKWVSRQNEFLLPSFYDWADIFIFTTLQDGFAAVLAQAQAAGLPILSTVNCSAPDFIQDDVNGWLCPIRSPETFVRRLAWCDSHREEMMWVARKSYDLFQPRSWANMADDLIAYVKKSLNKT